LKPIAVAFFLLLCICSEAAEVIQMQFDGKAVEAAIQVTSSPPNRLVFGSLRSSAELGTIALLDPNGQIVWEQKASELLLLPSSETKNPELGALYNLGERQGLIAGIWRLRVSPKSTATKGRLIASYLVRGQFELAIPVLPSIASTPFPTVVPVLASDFGKPVTTIPAIRVWAEDSNGHVVISGEATQNAKSAKGIALNNQPGVYYALLRLSVPGRYRLHAEHDFGNQRVTATQTVEVRP
jgi:hypothetical protein